MSSLRDAAEHLAWKVLVRAGATRPPVDIDAVAAAEGLLFRAIGFTTCSGAYLGMVPGARPPFDHAAIAVIGSHQHPLRQRFTKAHELGHHLVDEPRDWVVRMALPLPRNHKRNDYHPAQEFFAASLLMPRAWVDRFDGNSWRHRDVARLARHFGVTRVAAAVRVQELYGRDMDLEPAGNMGPYELA